MSDIQVKIMIVEDDIIIAQDIEKSIRQIGYDIIANVPSGEEALEIVRKLQPDLILMDIVLKGHLNGIDTAKMIYEQLTIPVVFLTAYSDKITLGRAQIAHPYGYICKPFARSELKNVITKALNRYWEEQDALEG